ncbi:ATPase, T2SS/T4P/T4SS family [Azospirillum sp. BE72]|uniref:ATPase, T2SS/T4P/T4SS family n=1 Tax=Azospirillum sp. BE72 TaxID=2817776 RepID=UPI002866ADCF|nr:ATPase, T2SS/T4P/T4SS family [Azospirillum sp. BE72]MDR6773297.1 Flp pilus assembly CpaF family ATPase [Azospirillum sp. BE72]
MTGPAGSDPDRQALLLASLGRLREDLFGDLLARDDVANVLVLPPLRGQGNCRVLVKNGPSPEFVREADPDQVRRFLATVAGFQRKELRRDRPTLDVTLPETGERIHADIEPVTTGPACSIRKPYRGRITLDDWVRSGAATTLQARILRRLIAGRRTVVIAGDVDTGKTTLLRACLEEPAFRDGLPAVLQDPYEFEPPCPHAYAMVADPWAEPPVTLETLVANALRVPMTHLVLGEVRRAEARQMVVGWTTGHPGLCTVHAGSAWDALDRIAQMVGLGGVVMDALQMRWIAKAVHVVVHLARYPDGRRFVNEIVRVERFDPDHGFVLRPLGAGELDGGGDDATQR